MVFKQPGTSSVRQAQRQRSGCRGVPKHWEKHDGSLQRPLEIRQRPRQQTRIWLGQRERQETHVERRQPQQSYENGRSSRLRLISVREKIGPANSSNLHSMVGTKDLADSHHATTNVHYETVQGKHIKDRNLLQPGR